MYSSWSSNPLLPTVTPPPPPPYSQTYVDNIRFQFEESAVNNGRVNLSCLPQPFPPPLVSGHIEVCIVESH